MKKNLIFAAIAVLALTACSNDDEFRPNGGKAIRLTSSLGVAGTRAATDIQTSAFDAETPVNVFITENNPGATETTYPQPIEAKAQSGGALDLQSTYYYPTSGNGVDIYALHPSTVTKSGTFTVEKDQTTDAAYKASDLMYGKPAANPVSPAANAVDIQFTHLLSKVTIKLEAGDNVTSLAGAKVELLGVKPSTTLTAGISGSTISAASGTATDIIVMEATASATSGSAIIVPQTLQETFLQVTLDGATLRGKLDGGAPTLVAGNEYTYNITVNMRGQELVVTSTIKPWDNGGTDTGSVNPL